MPYEYPPLFDKLSLMQFVQYIAECELSYI